jgi:DNA polymerase-3 subunit epsilon
VDVSARPQGSVANGAAADGANGAGGGTVARTADTLLVDRARDFLAAGPATAVALVARVCQIPGVPVATAERIAGELLGAHPSFARAADGRWTLAAAAPSHREAGAPVAAAARPRIPTFAEWQAARRAEQQAEQQAEQGGAADPASRAGAARRPRAAAPPRALPGDDDPLGELSYVVVDVETTGGTPQSGHRVTEIAAVTVEGGEVRGVYETLVNPERGIPPEIVRLTGITWEMVRGRAPFRGVAEDVVAALGGRVFVAHNAAFDWRFVSHEVERATGRVLEGRRLCTVRLARKLLPHLRSRSLGYVADWYGATTFAETYFAGRPRSAAEANRPWRHSAAGDAVATAHCLVRLLADAREHGVHTWGEMDRWLAGGTGGSRRKRTALPTGVRRDPLG